MFWPALLARRREGMLPHLVSISSFQSATCLRVFLLVTSNTTIQAWRRTVRRPQTSYDDFKVNLMLMLLVMSAHTQTFA